MIGSANDECSLLRDNAIHPGGLHFRNEHDKRVSDFRFCPQWASQEPNCEFSNITPSICVSVPLKCINYDSVCGERIALLQHWRGHRA